MSEQKKWKNKTELRQTDEIYAKIRKIVDKKKGQEIALRLAGEKILLVETDMNEWHRVRVIFLRIFLK